VKLNITKLFFSPSNDKVVFVKCFFFFELLLVCYVIWRLTKMCKQEHNTASDHKICCLRLQATPYLLQLMYQDVATLITLVPKGTHTRTRPKQPHVQTYTRIYCLFQGTSQNLFFLKKRQNLLLRTNHVWFHNFPFSIFSCSL